MKLRTRLSLAFFLISVVPLGLVTAYSYYSSAAALRRAVEVQADQMAAEMGDRMTWVMADLGDRVERLWRMRVEEPAAAGDARRTTEAEAAQQASANLQSVAKAMLAEAAPLVQRLEFSATGASTTTPAGSPVGAPAAPTGAARSDSAAPRRSSTGRPADESHAGAPPPPSDPAELGRPGPPPGFRPGVRGGGAAPRGVPVFVPGMPQTVIEMKSDRVARDTAETDATFELLTPDAVNAWRRAIQRQVDREGGPGALAGAGRGEGRRGPGSPMAGVAPQTTVGTRSGATAAQAGDAQAAALRAASAQAARARRVEERQQRMAALAHGEALQFDVRRAGEVIGQIHATVDRNRVIETVLSLGRRDRGEIPFVLDESGKVHTVDTEAARTIQSLAIDTAARAAHASSTTRLAGDWLVVTRRDPSGIIFGLARPIRDSLRDMRRASLGNLAIGLLLIAGAFAIILPLATRMTRHITALNAGVRRLAAGDRQARVEERGADEIGELARSFNVMASQLESHDRILAKQERMARELELCRQIQNEMLPHGPLRVGLAEVAGVSIPAREVGGDFFNYFALDDGRIALLVGDVSGKGVAAALLMANIQATLRAKLDLESDLAHLADGVDRDIAANTPPEVYITLFVGLLDPACRELRYVNAGHNPQFLLRAGGGLERLDSTGLPIGLLPGRGFEERRIQVEPGDLLFLYTDGTTEAPNEAGEFFDANRLEQALVAASADGVDEVLVRVEETIRAFRGQAEPADDATMLALRLGPPR